MRAEKQKGTRSDAFLLSKVVVKIERRARGSSQGHHGLCTRCRSYPTASVRLSACHSYERFASENTLRFFPFGFCTSTSYHVCSDGRKVAFSRITVVSTRSKSNTFR